MKQTKYYEIYNNGYIYKKILKIYLPTIPKKQNEIKMQQIFF
jgi:hypothetical protein